MKQKKVEVNESVMLTKNDLSIMSEPVGIGADMQPSDPARGGSALRTQFPPPGTPQLRMADTRSLGGFTLVESMLVVAIIGLLAAIAVPNFVRARESAQFNSILNNLRMIENAKQQWAIETRAVTSANVTSASLCQYLRNNQWVTQLAGEVYEIGTVGNPAKATGFNLLGFTQATAAGGGVQ